MQNRGLVIAVDDWTFAATEFGFFVHKFEQAVFELAAIHMCDRISKQGLLGVPLQWWWSLC